MLLWLSVRHKVEVAQWRLLLLDGPLIVPFFEPYRDLIEYMAEVPLSRVVQLPLTDLVAHLADPGAPQLGLPLVKHGHGLFLFTLGESEDQLCQFDHALVQ